MMNECSFHLHSKVKVCLLLNPADLSDVTIYLENAFVFEYITLLFLESIAHFGPFGKKACFGGGMQDYYIHAPPELENLKYGTIYI